MKIFMIDDNERKQRFFIRIFDLLNGLCEKENIALRFETGFGRDPVQAVQLSKQPERVREALFDHSDGIFLVDLKMPETDSEAENKTILKALMQRGKHPAVREYEEWALHPEEYDFVAMYPFALQILVAARELGRPTLLVSTQGEGSAINQIIRSGLVTAAAPDFPYAARIYSDAELLSVARKILGLVDKTGLLRILTRDWFASNDEPALGSQSSTLPHNPPTDYSTNNLFWTNHRTVVKSVFRFFPNEWWASGGKALTVHRCLQTVVGNGANWMGGLHPLSLAGAYFIFLMAVAEKTPAESMSPFLAPDLSCFCGSAEDSYRPLPFLGLQDQSAAITSFKALYEFFRQIIIRKDLDELGVGAMTFPSEGCPQFSIKLNWNRQDLDRFGGDIRSSVADGLAGGSLKFHSGKTVGALWRFIIASQVRDSGFGSRGAITLDDDKNASKDERGWLRIGEFGSIR